jgi:hypothetical protein
MTSQSTATTTQNTPIIISHSAQTIIENTYFPAIQLLIANGNHYVAFSLMSSVIEVMGALFDNFPLDKSGESAKRFNAAIEHGFRPLCKGYENYTDKNAQYYLYGGLRCGMLHSLQPQKNIGLTHLAESLSESTQHLKVETTHQKLILVSEHLFDDIKRAWENIVNNPNKRSHAIILMNEYKI